MEKKTAGPTGRPDAQQEGNPHLKKEVMDAKNPLTPGISQPHNAKKEALGPNTKR